MLIASSGPVYFAGVSHRFVHEGRVVEAARFVANGPEIAAWAGPEVEATGRGLSGTLRLKGAEVATGDWVVKDGEALSVVPQELFSSQYVMVN
ncbi:hypothetical protein [Bosea sp. (in: a-proteobacteria)]|uniref:hypothetical protein n=1 Tax=Bosea sp. (in: a-proteobacteria) TaxID=1871050 RepID=UPI001AC43E25|nr:hypothetical protein [Bosea sp. (in: a-proteobacteria)]MBN9438244.1 hypothetical protein [Bosea sp. (in: a-proteobacteria)]